MERKPLDYASDRTPRRPLDWLRFAPFFAILCAAFAWLKSEQYHQQGHLRGEQIATLLFVALSLLCLVFSIARFPRYRSDGPGKLTAIISLCAVALACNAVALWNLYTATGGLKDQLF